jgi:tetratricopeptide (TPR) repeat protein
MNQQCEISPELRELLGDVGASRAAGILAHPLPWPRSRASRQRIERAAREELLSVHRDEVARLLFLEGQAALAGGPGLSLCIVGLRSPESFEREVRPLRQSVVRFAERLDPERAPTPLGPDASLPPADRAMRLFRQSLELVPNSLVRAGLALLEASGGKPGQALRTLESNRHAHSPRALARTCQARAFAAQLLGDMEGALEAQRSAVHTDETVSEALIEWTYLALDLGHAVRFEEAFERLSEMTSLEPAAVEAIELKHGLMASADPGLRERVASDARACLEHLGGPRNAVMEAVFKPYEI